MLPLPSLMQASFLLPMSIGRSISGSCIEPSSGSRSVGAGAAGNLRIDVAPPITDVTSCMMGVGFGSACARIESGLITPVVANVGTGIVDVLVHSLPFSVVTYSTATGVAVAATEVIELAALWISARFFMSMAGNDPSAFSASFPTTSASICASGVGAATTMSGERPATIMGAVGVGIMVGMSCVTPSMTWVIMLSICPATAGSVGVGSSPRSSAGNVGCASSDNAIILSSPPESVSHLHRVWCRDCVLTVASPCRRAQRMSWRWQASPPVPSPYQRTVSTSFLLCFGSGWVSIYDNKFWLVVYRWREEGGIVGGASGKERYPRPMLDVVPGGVDLILKLQRSKSGPYLWLGCLYHVGKVGIRMLRSRVHAFARMMRLAGLFVGVPDGQQPTDRPCRRCCSGRRKRSGTQPPSKQRRATSTVRVHPACLLTAFPHACPCG
ncbi:hypothetical protein L1887_52053 [Cichorium endivia]|nr:hypothetical protein L1887_52053 [Cichorium endivia]